ncbi:MAG: hypothetical protein K9M03_02370 [Kiritimatiellales bacterium]|nr:hypothetical protein [Kiritimatiellales bacterium]
MASTFESSGSSIDPEILEDRFQVLNSDGDPLVRDDDEESGFEDEPNVNNNEDDEVPLTTGEGSETQIDDPVKIYLMQMGEIPLLTRPEEIAAAKRIEKTRTRFRKSLLGTDYAIAAAANLLDGVKNGRSRIQQ